MASNYGLNFGFRRSDESMAIREGRQKVPANPAGGFYQGMPVTFDEANPGFVRVTEPGEPAISGYTGMLVQEDSWNLSIYEAQIVDTFALSRVNNGALCTIWSGNGTKVWMKNTDAQLRADGRSLPAVEIVDFAGGTVELGSWLGAGADGKWAVVGAPGTPAPDEAQMKVTLTDGVAYLEAVLIK